MTKPTICLQDLKKRIGARAKSAPTHRFWGMFVHVTKLETLEVAYREAKRNRGAPGADGVTFAQVEAEGPSEMLRQLQRELHDNTYVPQPNRKREIPKGGGKVRVISIPTIRDRVVQGALRQVLEPIFEADFSDSSFGARPRRSAYGALGVIRRGLQSGRRHVVDVDLASFFDGIRHDRLLERVARRVQDPQVLAAVKRFLKSGGRRGIPQGSPLSPLLANIALSELDQALDRGHEVISYARYLDDMVVLAPDSPRGRRWAERALDRIREEAEAIGVALNEEKTKTIALRHERDRFAFLGFDISWRTSRRSGRGYGYMAPRAKKVTEVLRRVRDELDRTRHLQMQEAVQRVNRIVMGWVNYFRVANSSRALQLVKYEVERKVRRFAMRKSKRRGFGWKRWDKDVVYGVWGLYGDYQVRYIDFLEVGPSRAVP